MSADLFNLQPIVSDLLFYGKAIAMFTKDESGALVLKKIAPKDFDKDAGGKL